MKLAMNKLLRSGNWLGLCVIWMAVGWMANAQGFATTTVQGTVYSASDQPAAGTLQLSWPAFTTANNQAVAAGQKGVAWVAFTSMAFTGQIRTQAYDCLHLFSTIFTSAM